MKPRMRMPGRVKEVRLVPIHFDGNQSACQQFVLPTTVLLVARSSDAIDMTDKTGASYKMLEC
jgi:hypothetical protein